MVLQRLIWLQLEMPMRYLLSPWRMFWRHTSLKRPTVQTPEKYWSLHSTPLAPCLVGSYEHALHELKEIEKPTVYQCWSYFDVYLRSATLVWEPKLHYLARGCLINLHENHMKLEFTFVFMAIFTDQEVLWLVILIPPSSLPPPFRTVLLLEERGRGGVRWLIGWLDGWLNGLVWLVRFSFWFIWKAWPESTSNTYLYWSL